MVKNIKLIFSAEKKKLLEEVDKQFEKRQKDKKKNLSNEDEDDDIDECIVKVKWIKHNFISKVLFPMAKCQKIS